MCSKQTRRSSAGFWTRGTPLGGAMAVVGGVRADGAEVYDFEEEQSYSVVVTVVDGNGGTDSVQVDVSVLNEPEWPSVLDAPTVLPVPGTRNSLEATWQAPDSRGKPPIESYEILVQQPHPPDSFATAAGTSSILTDLAPLTTYAVRVRAINADGLSSDFPGAATPGPTGRRSATARPRSGTTFSRPSERTSARASRQPTWPPFAS